MGSKQGSSITLEMRSSRRRLCGTAQKRNSMLRQRKKMQRSEPSTNVTEKLMALNNLVNPLQASEEVKPDELFQETANYIVLLKTQVSILQKLVDFYGSSGHEQVQQSQQSQQSQNVVV